MRRLERWSKSLSPCALSSALWVRHLVGRRRLSRQKQRKNLIIQEATESEQGKRMLLSYETHHFSDPLRLFLLNHSAIEKYWRDASISRLAWAFIMENMRLLIAIADILDIPMLADPAQNQKWRLGILSVNSFIYIYMYEKGFRIGAANIPKTDRAWLFQPIMIGHNRYT